MVDDSMGPVLYLISTPIPRSRKVRVMNEGKVPTTPDTKLINIFVKHICTVVAINDQFNIRGVNEYPPSIDHATPNVFPSL
jgi:hypothetical protein